MRARAIGFLCEFVIVVLQMSGVITLLTALCIAIFLGIWIGITWPPVRGWIFSICKIGTPMTEILMMGMIGPVAGGFLVGGGHWLQQRWETIAKEQESQRLTEEKQKLAPRLTITLHPDKKRISGSIQTSANTSSLRNTEYESRFRTNSQAECGV